MFDDNAAFYMTAVIILLDFMLISIAVIDIQTEAKYRKLIKEKQNEDKTESNEAGLGA
jgi:hypothetical protein